jgi:phospholipid-binding lipoprotein MlaA
MKYFQSLVAVFVSAFLVGCSHQVQKSPSSSLGDVKQTSAKANVDPFEKYNRVVFKVNKGLMETVFEPVVNIYDKSFPSFIREGVHNFFGNIQMFPTIGNDLLQANFKWAGRDFMRLFLNTTLGGVGFVDVASSVHLYPRSQSFGLTLGKWGVKDTPYVVLPILGPTTVRGVVGLVPDFYMSPINYMDKNRYFWGLKAIEYIQIGSDVFPKVRFIMDNSLDPYVAMRNAYLQNQHYLLEQVVAEKDSDDPGFPVQLTAMAAESAHQHKAESSTTKQPTKTIESIQGAATLEAIEVI